LEKKPKKLFLVLSFGWILCFSGCQLTIENPSTHTPASETIQISEQPTRVVTETSSAVNISVQGTIVYTDRHAIYALDFQEGNVERLVTYTDGVFMNVQAVGDYIYYFKSVSDDDPLAGGIGINDVFRVHRLDSSDLSRLTTDYWSDFDLTVTSNGRYLAYISDWGPDMEENRYKVVVLDITTGESEFIVESNTPVYKTLWSPDGEKLLYFERSGSHQFGYYGNLYIINVDDRTIIPILPESVIPVTNLAWSIDSNSIALGIMIDQQYDIYLVDIDNGNTRKLAVTEWMPLNFLWSPNGNNLLFEMEMDHARIQLCLLDINTGDIVTIAEEDEVYPHIGFNALWSPNGEWLAYFVNPEGESFQVKVYSLGTGEELVYPITGIDIESASWVHSP